MSASPARVQWDPERSLRLAPLPYRSLQLGLSGEAVDRYVEEWIVGIGDVSDLARAIKGRLDAGDERAAAALLPEERPYTLPPAVGVALGVDPADDRWHGEV